MCSILFSMQYLAESACWLFQHEASRTAFEDAQKQMGNILERIEEKASSIAKLQSDLEKHKHEASEAHKVEEVRNLFITIPFFVIFFLCRI